MSSSIMFIAAVIVSLSPLACSQQAPSLVPRYLPVLRRAKLQAPTSSQAASSSSLLSGYSSQYFFLTNGYMTFKIKGNGMRSELRQMEADGPEAEWSVKDLHTMNARVEIAEPEDGITEITFLQILCTDGVEFWPAMRISWRREFGDREDVIAATIRMGAGSESYNFRQFYLTSRNAAQVWTVKVSKSRLNIFANGRRVLRSCLEFWEPFVCNFKAGAYLQKPTRNDVYANTTFKELMWDSDGISS